MIEVNAYTLIMFKIGEEIQKILTIMYLLFISLFLVVFGIKKVIILWHMDKVDVPKVYNVNIAMAGNNINIIHKIIKKEKIKRKKYLLMFLLLNNKKIKNHLEIQKNLIILDHHFFLKMQIKLN